MSVQGISPAHKRLLRRAYARWTLAHNGRPRGKPYDLKEQEDELLRIMRLIVQDVETP